jgi:dipeptidyl aminopeptidase/acylaminoacyl peptidase
VSRVRNFSNWAYWRLGLEQLPATSRPADPDSWRARTRARLDERLGAHPERVPLDLEAGEEVDCGAYTRARVVFDTEATMSVPAYLLVPHARREAPAGPAVLAVHGHGPGKSLVCGIDAGGEGDDYAHSLAELGYVVLAPDLRGFGERAEWMPDDHYHCDWDLVCATMAGVVPLERNVWDLMRAIDVLAEHPLVDPARIGAGGLSYGGTCTLFLTALDPRVRACVVSGYLSSWKAAHTVPWNMCGSQVFAAIPHDLEHVDVAALVAPRPMLVETGTEDVIFPVDAARATVAGVLPLYERDPERADALVHDVFDGGHRWHGTHVADFLERWL